MVKPIGFERREEGTVSFLFRDLLRGPDGDFLSLYRLGKNDVLLCQTADEPNHIRDVMLVNVQCEFSVIGQVRYNRLALFDKVFVQRFLFVVFLLILQAGLPARWQRTFLISVR